MKKVLCSIMCLIAVLTLTGCISKTVIGADKFTEKLESNGFEVLSTEMDRTEISVARIAKKDDLQIEYYELKDTDAAKSMYESNRANISKRTNSHVEVNGTNYSTYSGSGNGIYAYIARVENTFLFVETSETNKEEAKKAIDEIGY